MDRESLLHDASALLEKAKLSDEDRTLWMEQLKTTSTEALMAFVDMIDEDESILSEATESLKRKAAAKDDSEAIKKVFENERDTLTGKINN